MSGFVDIATAREAAGVRMVVAGIVPSPWSEASKGLFRLAGIPALVVRAMPRDREIAAWAGADNVPVVFHDREPPRTCWSAIVGLVARLAPGTVLPTDAAARADVMGALDVIAGEDGLGWNARLAMVHAGITSDGARGFGQPAAGYLARRYGYTPAHVDGLHARVTSQLGYLADRLAAQQARGHAYLGGPAPSALDVYTATFLTPLARITEADCPALQPPQRAAFAAAAEDLGPLVPPALVALRARMFEQHLEYPIAL